MAAGPGEGTFCQPHHVRWLFEGTGRAANPPWLARFRSVHLGPPGGYSSMLGRGAQGAERFPMLHECNYRKEAVLRSWLLSQPGP